MNLLDVTGIFKEEQGTNVLTDVSFSQTVLQNLAISGESGAGKSTLLKIISGLSQADGGTVLLSGNRVEGPLEKLIPGHPRIAYLSQHFELRNHYRVAEVLEYANRLSDMEAGRLYEVCRIDGLLSRWTHELSGGEKQRVALARLLGSSPDLILLDEPFSNLDPIHTGVLKGVIADITKSLAVTCLLSSHDPHDTLPWADRILVMRKGKIVQQGSPQEIYRYPAEEYVAGLFGSFNVICPSMRMAFPALQVNTFKRRFLRPEDFSLNIKQSLSVSGTVSGCLYMGSHYEVTVQLADTRILVHSTCPYSQGETVSVTLKD